MNTAIIREILPCELQAMQAEALMPFSVPYSSVVTAVAGEGWYVVDPPVRLVQGKLYVAILPVPNSA